MNIRYDLFITLLISRLFIHTSNAQTFLTRLDFSGSSLKENQITVFGAGFGEYPIADVSFAQIPTDNAFKDATDGQGMIQMKQR